MLEANFLTIAHIDQNGIPKIKKNYINNITCGLTNEQCINSVVYF